MAKVSDTNPCPTLIYYGGGGLVAKSCPTLATPWTVAHHTPLSLGFPGKNTGVGYHFLLHTEHYGFLFPTFMSTLVISCLFDDSHSNWCKGWVAAGGGYFIVVMICISLIISDDEWWLVMLSTFLYTFGHLYAFFEKLSIHFLYLFLNCVWIFAIELYVFYIFSWCDRWCWQLSVPMEQPELDAALERYWCFMGQGGRTKASGTEDRK